mmetsp:Transcript_32792/g.103733  ORF Transcript_32792/g.103733 Transcript_32792/m.103733 type:complete len:114 (-) Transcript_32792:1378-1719(-)
MIRVGSDKVKKRTERFLQPHNLQQLVAVERTPNLRATSMAESRDALQREPEGDERRGEASVLNASREEENTPYSPQEVPLTPYERNGGKKTKENLGNLSLQEPFFLEHLTSST